MLEIAFGTYCITAVGMATRLLPAPSDVKVLFLFVATQCIPTCAGGGIFFLSLRGQLIRAGTAINQETLTYKPQND